MSALPVASATREALTLDALYTVLVERRIILDARAARAGRLTFTAPDGAMTPAILAALALHKRALLAAITEKPASVRPVRVCAWGAPHFQAWRYHAGERRLVCSICYPSAWDTETTCPIPSPTPPDNAGQRPTLTPTPDAPGGEPATPDAPTVKPSLDAPDAPRERPGSSRGGWHGSRPADRLAVLDVSGEGVGVWVENDAPGASLAWVRRATLAPEALPTPGACDVGALLALAARLDVTQLWIHPSWARLAGLPARAATRDERREGIPHPFISDARADGWDMQPARLAPWIVGLRPGVWGRYALAFPHLDTRAGWSDAPDGATLLEALIRYRDALAGYAYRRGPGATATGLLKRLHAGRTALDLSASMRPEDFPPPAREPATVTDMAWIRPLTSAEASLADRGGWVHGYDKHAMYLGAMSALWLGMGEARHLAASSGAGGELAGLVASAATKDRTPGYWLASIAYDPPASMPNPFADILAPRADRATWRADAPQWVTTPTLDLALELGARVDVTEAYVWSERHRPLETWRNTLKDARETLHREAQGLPDTSAPAVALAVVKATYTQGIGWLDGKWLRARSEPEDLYRPDWRHTVMAQARANFYRNGLAVYRAHGLAPFAAYTDAWYYALADGDAARACPSTDKVMRLDAASLAGWSVKASAPLASVRPSLDALAALATPRGVPAHRLWKVTMNALHSEDDTTEDDATGAPDEE